MVLNSVLLYSIVKCFCHSHLYVTGVVHSKNVYFSVFFFSLWSTNPMKSPKSVSQYFFFFFFNFPTLSMALPPSLLVPAEDVYFFLKHLKNMQFHPVLKALSFPKPAGHCSESEHFGGAIFSCGLKHIWCFWKCLPQQQQQYVGLSQNALQCSCSWC